MNSSKPLTVTLGEQQQSLDTRLQSGEYESASDVVRAGLRALDREDAARDDDMRAKIQEALYSLGPGIPASDVFDRLEQRHIERMRARNGDL